MTPEVASLAAGLPDDWFLRAQRAFADLQFRFERRQRELGLREQELEMRGRDLAGRAEQLREAFRKAEETSQELMARTHGLRGEEKAIAAERDAVYREREEVAKAREEVSRRLDELAGRETTLGQLDHALKEREAAVAQWESEIRTLREQQEAALAAARASLAHERTIAAQANLPSTGPEEHEHVRRILELEAALESAAVHLHSREGEAERLLANATERAAQVQTLEDRIREQETRLGSMREEIVNAKRALLAVDDALTRMPYEVVDDFTRSEAFDVYERAVRALKQFGEGIAKGT